MKNNLYSPGHGVKTGSLFCVYQGLIKEIVIYYYFSHNQNIYFN